MKLLIAKGWLLLFCLMLLPGNIFSSSYFGNLELMTTGNGLNNNTVYDLSRGNEGFIWLCNDMGISRYDGFHFRNYPLTPSADAESSLLPYISQGVRKIYQDAYELLYLQLLRGGLVCFDTRKECYLPVRFEGSFDEKSITSLYLVDRDVLYIATEKGLYSAVARREGEKQSEQIVLSATAKPLAAGNISHLCSDNKSNLFFCLNKKEVIHYTMGTRQMIKVPVEGEILSGVTHLSVEGGHLWVCSKWGGVYCYNFDRKTGRTLSGNQGSGFTSLSDTYVTGVAAMDAQTFYLSTWAGLYCLKFDSQPIVSASYTIDYVTDREKMNRFSLEGKMTDVLWDTSQNMLWVGTFGGGVVKIGFNEDVYSRVGQQLNAEISGIEEDSKGYIWLTTNRKGIWKSTTDKLNSDITFQPWTKSGRVNSDYCIYKDKNGYFWFGDDSGRVMYVNPVTEEMHEYRLSPIAKPDFSGSIRRFLLDSRDRLWVVTSQGLILFDYHNQKCDWAFAPDATVKEVYTIAEDKEGTIWVGTDAGLKRLDMSGAKNKLIGDYEKSVGQGTVYAIYVNNYNQIFASYQDKIIRIDGRQKDKVETLFTLTNGLGSGHIYCMADDLNGNTWVGSNSGIMTIRNDLTTFYNYSLTGFCNQVCRLSDGRLLWADSWGLIFFDPLIVKNRQCQKRLIVSDVWVNGQPVPVNKQVNGQVILEMAPNYQTDGFVFNARNNDFHFFFSDMQYGMMQRKIAYRLLPDEEWELCSLEDGIHYSRLAGGKYTLQVKLIYPDASEGETLEVPIVVKEFWWHTVWAYLLYVILAIGVLGAVYYILMQKERKRMMYLNREEKLYEKLDLVKTEQEQKKEVDILRNYILMRFIQELRTPLSLIVAPLREVLSEKGLPSFITSKMMVAYRNSMGMANACDQLLAISTYNHQENALKVGAYPIAKVIDSCVYALNEFLRVHPIVFRYEKKVEDGFEVWVDKKKIELVVHNLLSNAFIHVRYAGEVALLIESVVENEQTYCKITVTDNADCEVKLINRKTDMATLAEADSAAVELGYDMMEDIIEVLHGSITYQNMKEGGTKVEMKIVTNREAFAQDENVEYVTSEEMQEEILAIKENEVVEVPKVNTPVAEPQKVVVEPLNKEKKTLLVIEDYKDIYLYLKTLFGKDYNVLIAPNGVDGVEMARKELPDLILCDVMMPLKDGFECCKELKEGLDTCHIPFILLTAKVEDDDIVRGLELGADDYILKPFTPRILKLKVKNLIEGRTNLKEMYTRFLTAPMVEEEKGMEGAVAEEVQIEDPFISNVVKIIEENIQEADFNVKKLASDLNMSQPTLYRKVKQCTDYTIIELIRGVRLRKAAILLKEKSYSVQEVAEMVGYNDIPTFRKHFVDMFKTTPSTYAALDESGKNKV